MCRHRDQRIMSRLHVQGFYLGNNLLTCNVHNCLQHNFECRLIYIATQSELDQGKSKEKGFNFLATKWMKSLRVFIGNFYFRFEFLIKENIREKSKKNINEKNRLYIVIWSFYLWTSLPLDLFKEIFNISILGTGEKGSWIRSKGAGVEGFARKK